MSEYTDLISEIISFEQKRYRIYLELAEMECSNSDHSQEYSIKLKELSELCDKNTEIYQKLPDDSDEIAQFIIELLEGGEELENLDSIDYWVNITDRITEILNIIQERHEQEDDYEDDYDDLFTFLFDDYEDDNDQIKNFMNKEFFVRLQDRIDNSQTDRENLIRKKYELLYLNPLLEQTALCVGFDFKNLPKLSMKDCAVNIGISEEQFLAVYGSYLSDELEDVIEDFIWLEKDDCKDKRVIFKLLDLRLELVLSCFDFVTLCQVKDKVMDYLKECGVKKSAASAIISENFDEAINYVCNYSPRISGGKNVILKLVQSDL